MRSASTIALVCALSAVAAADDGYGTQFLRMVRTSKKACADKDDVVDTHVSWFLNFRSPAPPPLTSDHSPTLPARFAARFQVSYRTSDGKETNALSFKIELDGTHEWKIVKHHENMKIKRRCMLHFYHVAKHYISYVCASMTGQMIIPPKINPLVSVNWKSLTDASKSMSLIPNPHLVGSRYKYTPVQTMPVPGCSVGHSAARAHHRAAHHAASLRRRRHVTSAAGAGAKGHDDDYTAGSAATTAPVAADDDDDERR